MITIVIHESRLSDDSLVHYVAVSQGVEKSRYDCTSEKTARVFAHGLAALVAQNTNEDARVR